MLPRIMMWANFRRNHVGQGTIAVPSPFSDGKDTPYWYNRIANMASDWSHTGITDVLFPQPLMTQGGQYPTSDGYGVYNDYDIGTRSPTRFGTAEQLRRAIAICHANGINVHLDHVMHQRSGGKNGVYRYDSATVKGGGRFPKDPGCFRVTSGRTAPPFVHADPVPSPGDDFAFGDEFCPVNAVPKNYVWDGLIDAGDWLFRTTGADGARLDDMKGMNVGFIKAFMNSKAMQGKFFFGEFASGSADSWYGGLGTNWWVDQVDGRASAIDFDFHYNMCQRMCQDAGAGTFYMGSLAGRGMIGNNPMKAIPFVESMDSDTNGFATIVFNKVLGYALLLTGEGLPQIYIRDYLKEPDCYGLRDYINNLIWVHQILADGTTVPVYRSAKVYAFRRTGPPGLIVALNNDVWNPNWYTITVQTGWAPGTRIHDYTGNNNSDCWVDNNGRITFGVPPGANGMGYGCWAPAGLGRTVERSAKRHTTQEFEGADDLDIPPLEPNKPLTVGRVWCDKATIMRLWMLNISGNPPDFPSPNLQVLSPDGSTLINNETTRLEVHIKQAGWHTLNVVPNNLTVNTRLPFRLRVQYTATETLNPEQF